MKRSKTNSSVTTSRAPYAPATELTHVPFVLFEIEELAEQDRAKDIIPLIRSVIKVTLEDPESLIKLMSALPLIAPALAQPEPAIIGTSAGLLPAID